MSDVVSCPHADRFDVDNPPHLPRQSSTTSMGLFRERGARGISRPASRARVGDLEKSSLQRFRETVVNNFGTASRERALGD